MNLCVNVNVNGIMSDRRDKRRKVVIIYLHGAFLQANWPKDNKCYIKFEGGMVDIILKINQEYCECVRENTKRRKVLYGRVSKIIYSTLLGFRFFFDTLVRISKRSSTRRTRHIHIRYLYITDMLKDDQGISVVYKPTVH